MESRAQSDYDVELIRAAEEAFEPIENGEASPLGVTEPEQSIEPGREKSEKKKENQERLEPAVLPAYFRDVLREPVLTPKEEREISAKMKNCEARIVRIKALIGDLSHQMEKAKLDDYGEATQYSLLRRIETLNICAGVYSYMAKNLRNRFINANLRLVLHIAKGYSNKGLPMLDIIQEGSLGLMRAVDKFDHEKGVRFSSYAALWINQSIIRAISTQAGTIKIPVYLLENSPKVYRMIAELDKEMGRRPLPMEIANRTGMSVNAVKRIIETKIHTTHLHSPVIDGENVTLFDVIADERSPVPDSMISKTELPKKVGEALSLLKPREEEIIRMRFGVNRENVVYTLDDIGNKFGLTRERIRQIQNKALKKIACSHLAKSLRSFREQ
jgi:RNA polymerase sigma factor (sigma-70 family)